MAMCSRCGGYVSSYGEVCENCRNKKAREDRERSESIKREQEWERQKRAEERKERAEKYREWYNSLSPAEKAREDKRVRRWNIITRIGIGVVVAAVAIFLLTKTAFFWGIAKNVTGVFGSNSVSEYSAMEQLRLSKFTSIKDKGEELDVAGIAANKTAIDTFIASAKSPGSESYSMKGTFEFGYHTDPDSPITNTSYIFTTVVEMSYNAELDVYKFTVKSKDGKGYQPLKDKKLAPFHIADGTYYIVTEDDKTYVLADCGGDKTVEDVTGGKGTYIFLTMYMMNGNIDTDFMDGKEAADTSYDYHVWDADYYFRSYADTKYNLYPRWIELKTHKGKPVKGDYRANVPGTDVGYKFVVDYYYSGIPKDAPAVADWK